jgi:hypothetical protein
VRHSSLAVSVALPPGCGGHSRATPPAAAAAAAHVGQSTQRAVHANDDGVFHVQSRRRAARRTTNAHRHTHALLLLHPAAHFRPPIVPARKVLRDPRSSELRAVPGECGTGTVQGLNSGIRAEPAAVSCLLDGAIPVNAPRPSYELLYVLSRLPPQRSDRQCQNSGRRDYGRSGGRTLRRGPCLVVRTPPRPNATQGLLHRHLLPPPTRVPVVGRSKPSLERRCGREK